VISRSSTYLKSKLNFLFRKEDARFKVVTRNFDQPKRHEFSRYWQRFHVQFRAKTIRLRAPIPIGSGIRVGATAVACYCGAPTAEVTQPTVDGCDSLTQFLPWPAQHGVLTDDGKARSLSAMRGSGGLEETRAKKAAGSPALASRAPMGHAEDAVEPRN
jgi:hypothetical protein